MLETLWQDVRHAARSLGRTPGFTVAAVLTLSLGIGGTTAIFSVFELMLLRTLPVPTPQELVNLSSPGPKPGRTSTSGDFDADQVFSYPLFRDLEREQTAFTGLAAHRDFVANVAYQGQAVRETGSLVSGSYFPALALRPARGRLLSPDDDRVRGGHPVVVLSHDYWRTRLNADPAVINQGLRVNGQLLTIVGVSPPGFTGTTLENRPQIFVPLTMAALMMPWERNPHADGGPWIGFDDRRDHWLYLFARMRPGVSREAATTAVNNTFSAIITTIELRPWAITWAAPGARSSEPGACFWSPAPRASGPSAPSSVGSSCCSSPSPGSCSSSRVPMSATCCWHGPHPVRAN